VLKLKRLQIPQKLLVLPYRPLERLLDRFAEAVRTVLLIERFVRCTRVPSRLPLRRGGNPRAGIRSRVTSCVKRQCLTRWGQKRSRHDRTTRHCDAGYHRLHSGWLFLLVFAALYRSGRRSAKRSTPATTVFESSGLG
jgi:hypothetical protein